MDRYKNILQGQFMVSGKIYSQITNNLVENLQNTSYRFNQVAGAFFGGKNNKPKCLITVD